MFLLARNHMIFGLGSWFAVSAVFRFPLEPVSPVIAVLGSLLPDIDHPRSTIGRKIAPVSELLSRTFGHRGLTHSLIAVCVLFTVAVRSAQGVAGDVLFSAWKAVPLALATGYFSHLVADAFTKAGVPLLYPWRRKFCIPWINWRTGSVVETPFCVFFALICAYWWWSIADRTSQAIGFIKGVGIRVLDILS